MRRLLLPLNKKPTEQSPATKATKELPNTGTEDHAVLAALGVLGLMSGFGLVSRKKKKKTNSILEILSSIH